jgi:hypothetical protein
MSERCPQDNVETLRQMRFGVCQGNASAPRALDDRIAVPLGRGDASGFLCPRARQRLCQFTTVEVDEQRRAVGNIWKHVVPIGLCLLVGVMVSPAQEPVHQVSIPTVENYPKVPSPFEIMEIRQRAYDSDNSVYDWNQSYRDCSMTTWNPVNLVPGMLNCYCNDATDEDALEEMASVVGATLVGIDKSDQAGKRPLLPFIPYENLRTLELGGRAGVVGKEIYGSGEVVWLYLMFEALGKTSDRELMLVNLICVTLLSSMRSRHGRSDLSFSTPPTLHDPPACLYRSLKEAQQDLLGGRTCA